jgi:hypothetical protein
MSIKTSKRIALGVIASLVFAPFAAIAPASAATTAVVFDPSQTSITVPVGTPVSVPVILTSIGTTIDQATTVTITPSVPNGTPITIEAADPSTTTLTIGANNWASVTATGTGSVALSAATNATGFSGLTTANVNGKRIGNVRFTPTAVGSYVVTLTGAGSNSVYADSTKTISITATNLGSALSAVVVPSSVNGTIFKTNEDNPTVVVSRPSGGVVADGAILIQTLVSPDAQTPVNTYFSADDNGVTVGADGSSRSFTFDTATATTFFNAIGTYTFRAFIDANANGTYESSESSTEFSFIVAGAPDSTTVSASVTSFPNVTATPVSALTISVFDSLGNPTYAATAVNVVDDPGNTTAENTAINPAAATATRIGSSNQYRVNINFTANGATTAGTTPAVRVDADGVTTTRTTVTFTVRDTLSADAVELALESKDGLYVGTPGNANYSTTIPVTSGTGATTVTTEVSAEITVKSFTFVFEGTASKSYAVSLTTTGGRALARYTYPTTITTLSDGKVTFIVENSAPVASATNPDTFTITVTDTVGPTALAYKVTYIANKAFWTLSPNATTKVLEKSTNTVTATLRDRFGRVMANHPYTVSVAGRNVTAGSGTTDANGVATYTVADTATSSYALVTGFPTDTVSFTSVVKLNADGTTAVAASDATGVSFSYVATLPAVATITVTSPAGAPFMIDQVLADPASPTTVTYTATARLATGAVAGSGILVTFAGGADDLFLNGIKTAVTNASGEATIRVYRHKVGFQVITATVGTVTGSSLANEWQNDIGTVPADGTGGTGSTSARNVVLSAVQTIVPGSAATVIATVTDRWGNPVQGHLVTWSTSGVGRAVTGADFTVGTDTSGQAQFQVTSLATESGAMTVRATISGGQTLDPAGFVAGTAVAGVTAGNTSATSTVNFTAPVAPEVVVPPVQPTLTGSLNGRVLLFGDCQADEGDMIIYVKSPGKPWQEKAKTLECVAGEFEGSIRAPKTTKYYRVKQEGTGLWSRSVLIRR